METHFTIIYILNQSSSTIWYINHITTNTIFLLTYTFPTMLYYNITTNTVSLLTYTYLTILYYNITTNTVSLLTYTYPTILYYNITPNTVSLLTSTQNLFIKTISFQSGLKPQSTYPTYLKYHRPIQELSKTSKYLKC